MKNMSHVLAAINAALDVPKASNSSLDELSRYFDSTTTEYVLGLEYRVRVPPKEPPEGPAYISPLIDAILDRPMRRRPRSVAASPVSAKGMK